MSDESLKRKGSLDIPPIWPKNPKLENVQVTEAKLEKNIEIIKNKINDVLMEKIDKIMKKVDNQEATLDLNSKLDKVLNVLDGKPERPKKRTYDHRQTKEKQRIFLLLWESGLWGRLGAFAEKEG